MTNRSPRYFEAMRAYNDYREEEAVRLIEACAEEGDPLACFMAALWRSSCQGTAASVEHSKKWLMRAEVLAQQGNAEAQWELGQHYRFGDLFPQSVDQANYWLERAAENEWGEAQHHLGWYYETGQYNYPIDMGLANEWYERAFRQQHPETIYLYAMRSFHDGKPTEKAINLLRLAADKGLKQAGHILKAYTH